MEFSRQEYWSVSPFPSPGDLPNPGIKPRSPTLRTDSLPTEPPGKPSVCHLKPSLLWEFQGHTIDFMPHGLVIIICYHCCCLLIILNGGILGLRKHIQIPYLIGSPASLIHEPWFTGKKWWKQMTCGSQGPLETWCWRALCQLQFALPVTTSGTKDDGSPHFMVEKLRCSKSIREMFRSREQ